MSEFITLYRRRQDIRFRMTKIRNEKNSQDEYLKLKEISEELNSIIEREKRIINLDKK